MSCEGCSPTSIYNGAVGSKEKRNCNSSGCKKLNVYNWLSDIPRSDIGAPFPIVEVYFKDGSRKDFFKNNTHHFLKKDDWVLVETTNGHDVGRISLTGELVKLQMKKHGAKDSSEIKKILRVANERDMEGYWAAKTQEKETLIKARSIARMHKMEMKISDIEIQADLKKTTVFYTADNRVDFRELIKVYASEFKTKIEMRQIGARQESTLVGGIGSCGRELCSSTWLTDYKSVSTSAARYQNLSINQAKLSGQCGKLKCCLNFELDMYLDALKAFPTNAETLELAAGKATLQKKDIFKNIMWYSFQGSSKQYPLSIERVKEILGLNKEGIIPEELEVVEIKQRSKTLVDNADFGFVNDVGQLSLNSLTKKSKKKSKRNKSNSSHPQKEMELKGNKNNSNNKRNPQNSNTPNQKKRKDNFEKPNDKSIESKDNKIVKAASTEATTTAEQKPKPKNKNKNRKKLSKKDLS